MSRPESTGALGRTGRLRAAQATASANASRSTRNFTRDPSRSGWGRRLAGCRILPRGADGGEWWSPTGPRGGVDGHQQVVVLPRSGGGAPFTGDRDVDRWLV